MMRLLDVYFPEVAAMIKIYSVLIILIPFFLVNCQNSDNSGGSNSNNNTENEINGVVGTISENQTFIVPSDAPNGEYVGQVRLFPQFEIMGDAAVFTLADNRDGIYAVDNQGIITIADNSNLTADRTDTLTVDISKNGYPDQSVSVDIQVVDAAEAIFIDGNAATNGTGKRQSPFNTVPTVTEDNTTLLFKRGSTITSGTNYH
jgi:hypothetical protein